jgi:4-amino-4-deoxy-L-arabinose transferase-like glycosyltransferase
VIFAVGLQIWSKLRDDAVWSPRDRWIAFLLLAAAMLIKGPIVYACLLPGIVTLRLLGKRNVWCGWWPWLASLAIFFVWVGYGIWRVPEFLELVVLREFGGRFEGTHQSQPLYFYFAHLLVQFAPWSLLLVALAWLHRKQKMPPHLLWLLCWSLGGIVFMSLVPSKRVDRIFPVVPPLCLLLAFWIAGKNPLRAAIACALLAIVFVTAYNAQKVVHAYRDHRDAYVQFARSVLTSGPRRLAVVGGEDEGLLLYFRKPEFVLAADAVAQWNDGAIDGIVAPDDELPFLTARLHDATESSLGPSRPAGNHGNRYTLLVRK